MAALRDGVHLYKYIERFLANRQLFPETLVSFLDQTGRKFLSVPAERFVKEGMFFSPDTSW